MQSFSGSGAAATFTPLRAAPRACVMDNKPHIRTFLTDMLDELGFISHGCAYNEDVRSLVRSIVPELLVLGIPDEGTGASGTMIKLAAEGFKGKVMLFGGRASLALISAHELGEKLRLAMLPPLGTPFRDSDLAENLSSFLPIRPAQAVPIDVEEALRKGWLELWYQPKVDPQALTLHGAEALIRMRHPVLGIVLPSYFIPGEEDRHFRALSEFVVERAMADWRDFASHDAPIELAINLPLALLAQQDFLDFIRKHMPRHAAFPGLMAEISSAEMVSDPALARVLTERVKDYNIRVSVADIAAEGPSLARMTDCSFAEFKVDWKLISGCAEELRKAVCGPIIDLARRCGARTVAVGIETPGDLQSVRDLGFGLVQGFLFAKPMEASKLVRMLRHGRPFG